MKALAIKLAGVAVLIVLIVFAIVLFRHGRTSATPQSEKKQAVVGVQDQVGEVETQQGEVNDPAYLAYKEKVDGYREQIEQRYPNTRQNKGAVELLNRVPQRYYVKTAGRPIQPVLASRNMPNNTQVDAPKQNVPNSAPTRRLEDVPGFQQRQQANRGYVRPAIPRRDAVASGDGPRELIRMIPERYQQPLNIKDGKIDLEHLKALQASDPTGRYGVPSPRDGQISVPSEKMRFVPNTRNQTFLLGPATKASPTIKLNMSL